MSLKSNIARRDHGKPAVLSFQEQQLWFLNQLIPDSPAYNCGYQMRLTGTLDSVAFRRSFHAVLERQQALRTLFQSDEGAPVRKVSEEWSQALALVDVSSTPEFLREAEAHRCIHKHGSRTFDFGRDLPMSAVLVRLSDELHIFAYCAHHIVWELRSTDLFFSELSHFYDAFSRQVEPEPLAPLQIDYMDYSQWQRDHLSGASLDRLQEYWKDRLADAPTRLNLPVDRAHPPTPSLHGARFPLLLQPGLKSDVDMFCAESRSTPFRVLGAAFNVLLSCYSGQEDICLGTPVTPPLPNQIEPLIGLFSYTVVVRTRLTEGITFRELCGQLGTTVTGAIRRALPFDLIVNAVQPPRDTSRMLLFQANLRVRQAPLEPLTLTGLEVSPPEWVDTNTSKFDLSFEIIANGGPGGFVEYRTDIFNESTIVRLVDDFYALSAGLIREPDCPLASLPEVKNLKSRFRRFKPQTPRTFQRGAGIELSPAVV